MKMDDEGFDMMLFLFLKLRGAHCARAVSIQTAEG